MELVSWLSHLVYCLKIHVINVDLAVWHSDNERYWPDCRLPAVAGRVGFGGGSATDNECRSLAMDLAASTCPTI